MTWHERTWHEYYSSRCSVGIISKRVEVYSIRVIVNLPVQFSDVSKRISDLRRGRE